MLIRTFALRKDAVTPIGRKIDSNGDTMFDIKHYEQSISCVDTCGDSWYLHPTCQRHVGKPFTGFGVTVPPGLSVLRPTPICFRPSQVEPGGSLTTAIAGRRRFAWVWLPAIARACTKQIGVGRTMSQTTLRVGDIGFDKPGGDWCTTAALHQSWAAIATQKTDEQHAEAGVKSTELTAEVAHLAAAGDNGRRRLL